MLAVFEGHDTTFTWRCWKAEVQKTLVTEELLSGMEEGDKVQWSFDVLWECDMGYEEVDEWEE